MSLAIFDLDNTLLGGDSDYEWGQFLVEKGIVDRTFYESENQRFYEEYKQGTLDIYAFLRFSLKPLKDNDLSQLLALRKEFVIQKIKPYVLQKGIDLVESHKARGDLPMIITATNRFVTEPIAELYGVDVLLATEPQMVNGQYTGDVAGIPCFQSGKVKNLNQWMAEHGYSLKGSYFYSDSHNDLPLLELVENPIVVDADDTLITVAGSNGWQILSLR